MVYELESVSLWLVKNLTFTKTYSNKKRVNKFYNPTTFCYFCNLELLGLRCRGLFSECGN